jgi:hypothetical protein
MEETIKKIETLQVSTEHMIRAEFQKLVKNSVDDIPIELKAELMAFHFEEENSDVTTDWGTYFGPYMVWRNDDGTSTVSPSIKAVDKETIEYWSKRLAETKNPLLKARYAGLVWDFSKPILNTNPDYKIGLQYVENLIEIVENRRHEIDFNLITKIKRAMQVAIRLNEQELIRRAKTAIIDLEEKIVENDKPGLWGFSFDMLIGNKKVILTQNEEENILSKLIQRFYNLTTEENLNIWAAEAAAERLANYYRKKNKIEKSQEIILNLGKAYEANEKNGSAMQITSWIQHLHKIYMDFNLHKEAEALLVRLREIGPKIKYEMNPVSTSVNVPAGKIAEIVDFMVDGEPLKIIYKLISNFVPQTKNVKQHLFEFAKRNPLTYLVPQSLHDSKGRLLATIGSFEDDFDGHFVSELSKSISIDGLFLRLVFEKLILDSIINQNDIIEFIEHSPVFEKSRIGIIQKGINSYFDKDYEIAIHLLIPQIEEAIRNFVEQTKGVVLKKNDRIGGFQLKTLHELLGDEKIKQVLGEDIQLYFKVLLTDQRGWNLRNNISHGMSEPDTFSDQSADRIMHVLLILGSLRKTKKAPTKSKGDHS